MDSTTTVAPGGLDPGAPLPGLSSPVPPAASDLASAFARLPGETPRAFSAFHAFFQQGHGRSLQTVAHRLGEKPGTVRNWSCKFHWSNRIQSFNSGLLQQQAEADAVARREHAADWARRTSDYREQEWAAVQKLLAATQCFLDSFGDRERRKMTLAQVSHALQISSRIARLSLSGSTGPEKPSLTQIQIELAAALNKAYAIPPAPPAVPDTSAVSSVPQASTLNSQPKP